MRYLIIALCLLLLIITVNITKQNPNVYSHLAINNVNLTVETVDTPDKISLGLSGRKRIGNNEGMLFIFNEPNTYSFWMKDMHFPIDIIWIDKTRHIVDITENITPDTYPNAFKPLTPVLYVLEVTSGFVKTNNINLGDTVKF